MYFFVRSCTVRLTMMMPEEPETSSGLTIAPNRDVLLMSRELRGRVAELDSADALEEDTDCVKPAEQLMDESPMVVVQRSSALEKEDAIIGSLQRVTRGRRHVQLMLRTTCDQALSVFDDMSGRSGRVYGSTEVSTSSDVSVRVAAGAPLHAEVRSLTPAGVCTLVLTFTLA